MDLGQYYSDICKYPNLTSEEEKTLFERYTSSSCSAKEKESIKTRIISANLRFAFKTARYYSKSDPGSFETLLAAANEGLVVGFEKYDPKNDKGVKFLSYAGYWVNQRILKEMSQMRIVSLPIWKQQLATKIQKAKLNNESITIEELKALFPEIKEKDISELYVTTYLTYYIDDMEEESFLTPDVSTSVQRAVDDERVWKAVASLPSPHREVLAKIFGLEDGEEYSIPQLCKTLKIPKETLKKIHTEGLSMLRNKLT